VCVVVKHFEFVSPNCGHDGDNGETFPHREHSKKKEILRTESSRAESSRRATFNDRVALFLDSTDATDAVASGAAIVVVVVVF